MGRQFISRGKRRIEPSPDAQSGLSDEQLEDIAAFAKFGSGSFIPISEAVPRGYEAGRDLSNGFKFISRAREKSTASSESPNNYNSLSDRKNKDRLGERIPDIFGTVISTPDLLASPYKIFEDSREVELSYMCIGRGQYEISDIKEDETPIEDIPGSSYAVYGPFSSPNNGQSQLTHGAINNDFLHTKKFEGVKDEDLPGLGDVGFERTLITLHKKSNTPSYAKLAITRPEFADYHNPGDNITIDSTLGLCYLRRVTNYILYPFLYYPSWWIYTTTPHTTLQLAGTYEIDQMGSNWITLLEPENVNADWQVLKDFENDMYSDSARYSSVPPTKYVLNTDQSNWSKDFNIFSETRGNLNTIGPYILENADSFIANFEAPDGLYSTADFGVGPLTHDIEIVATPIDASGSPTGSSETRSISIAGDTDNRQAVGLTYYSDFGFTGRMSVVFRLTTVKEVAGLTLNRQYHEDIVLKSLYSAKPIDPDNFGDITTIRVKSSANKDSDNDEASRNLSCKASRVIPTRQPDGSFVLSATSNFVDIARAVAIDSKIGNRPTSDLDIANFYETYDDVIANFGTDIAGEFNYTFDDNNLTFEETIGIVTQVAFCTVLRNGVLIQLSFEQANSVSRLLFNHRNKVPDSESRITDFGYLNDNDGIELEYRDIEDGAKLVFYEPADQLAVNALELAVPGITNKLQAYFHAKRLMQNQLYQNVTVEFEATAEAQLLGVNELIQVADGTRTNTFDGEVLSQSGLVLTLSQEFVFESGKSYTIFLQKADATLQAISISPGSNTYEITLAEAVTVPLALDVDLFARAIYEIVENSSIRHKHFLVKEKQPTGKGTVRITAVNYDQRYYTNDTDFINFKVNENGE